MIALLWLLILGTAWPALAQEQFTATVDRTTIRMGEAITYTLTFQGGSSSVPQPELPEFEKLQLVGGPFSSTSVSVINGRVSSSASYSYMLRASEAGSARIGAATLKYRGKEYHSQPITLTVLAGSGGGTAGRGQGSSGVQTAAQEDAFLRVLPDKTEAYIGEQITLTYKLYFNAQITTPELVRFPSASGFWVEDIPMPQQLTVQDEVVNGRQYRSVVIRKSALFPTTAGDLEVEPLVIGTRIERMNRRRPRDPRDIFSDPFFQLGRQVEQIEVVSPTLKLRAKALPAVDQPADFNGAVGSYKIRAALDSAAVATDRAVTLTVQIEGTGNIKTLAAPQIAIPPDIERFDPETSEEIRRSGTRIAGVKTFKYVLIPRAPGVQVIPAIQFSFFDPQKEQYQTASTGELRLNVSKGEGAGAGSGLAVATKHGVENVATDIAFAKTHSGSFVPIGGLPHTRVDFWAWALAPWAVLGTALLALRHRELQGQRLIGRRGALVRAQRGLDQAERAIKSRKPEVALRHVALAAEEALRAGLDRDDVALSPAELRELWLVRGLDPSALETLLEAQGESDRARFAAGGMEEQTVRRLIDRSREAIERMGRSPAKQEVRS